MERVVISNHCINTLSLRYFVSYVFGKPSNKATKVSSLKHLLCMIGFGKSIYDLYQLYLFDFLQQLRESSG